MSRWVWRARSTASACRNRRRSPSSRKFRRTCTVHRSKNERNRHGGIYRWAQTNQLATWRRRGRNAAIALATLGAPLAAASPAVAGDAETTPTPAPAEAEADAGPHTDAGPSSSANTYDSSSAAVEGSDETYDADSQASTEVESSDSAPASTGAGSNGSAGAQGSTGAESNGSAGAQGSTGEDSDGSAGAQGSTGEDSDSSAGAHDSTGAESDDSAQGSTGVTSNGSAAGQGSTDAVSNGAAGAPGSNGSTKREAGSPGREGDTHARVDDSRRGSTPDEAPAGGGGAVTGVEVQRNDRGNGRATAHVRAGAGLEAAMHADAGAIAQEEARAQLQRQEKLRAGLYARPRGEPSWSRYSGRPVVAAARHGPMPCSSSASAASAISARRRRSLPCSPRSSSGPPCTSGSAATATRSALRRTAPREPGASGRRRVPRWQAVGEHHRERAGWRAPREKPGDEHGDKPGRERSRDGSRGRASAGTPPETVDTQPQGGTDGQVPTTGVTRRLRPTDRANRGGHAQRSGPPTEQEKAPQGSPESWPSRRTRRRHRHVERADRSDGEQRRLASTGHDLPLLRALGSGALVGGLLLGAAWAAPAESPLVWRLTSRAGRRALIGRSRPCAPLITLGPLGPPGALWLAVTVVSLALVTLLLRHDALVRWLDRRDSHGPSLSPVPAAGARCCDSSARSWR